MSLLHSNLVAQNLIRIQIKLFFFLTDSIVREPKPEWVFGAFTWWFTSPPANPSPTSGASVIPFYSNSSSLRAIRSWRHAPKEVTSTKKKKKSITWPADTENVRKCKMMRPKKKGETVYSNRKGNNHRPGWKIRAIIWIIQPQNLLPDDWHKCVFFFGLHFHNRWNAGDAIMAF